MMRVLCTTLEHLPSSLPNEEHVFTFFKGAARPGVGTIARGWHGVLKRMGFAPTPAEWDFVQFCLAVCAADLSCERNTSADGWTRNIELTVGLWEPISWIPWKKHIEALLKVLTGDYWTINFVAGGSPPPKGHGRPFDRDCVSLLSGGLDSLIGGIDLVATGRKPILVSQLAHEDSERQRRYAAMLDATDTHMQWSHGISVAGTRETSTRARSLAFYGFAILAASRVAAKPAQVFVPENGLICINPPLVPGRVGSLSTRTTHPLFISMLQQLLDGLGVRVTLELPYQFKTKGQMLRECADQLLLSRVASDSTSCGRFRTYNRTHCGRCVPCMIRKSAFLAWGPGRDNTKYIYPSLRGSDKSSGPDDPMAAALAVLEIRERGLDRFLGSTLAFATVADRVLYKKVLNSGIAELEVLLQADGLL